MIALEQANGWRAASAAPRPTPLDVRYRERHPV